MRQIKRKKCEVRFTKLMRIISSSGLGVLRLSLFHFLPKRSCQCANRRREANPTLKCSTGTNHPALLFAASRSSFRTSQIPNQHNHEPKRKHRQDPKGSGLECGLDVGRHGLSMTMRFFKPGELTECSYEEFQARPRPDKPNEEALKMAAYRQWVRKSRPLIREIDPESAIQHPELRN